MSHPYIIWTLQRTGGTTLAILLRSVSEHPAVEDEPFNTRRVFGRILKKFITGKDRAALASDFHEVFSKSYVIKHCFELVPKVLNEEIIEVSSKLGYRHIILDRRSETDRILSLELAEATGAWGGARTDKVFADVQSGALKLPELDQKHAVDHLRLSYNRRLQLVTQLEAAGQKPFVVFYEDIYSDHDAGKALILRILEFLDIDPADHDHFDKTVRDALATRVQKTAAILEDVPNIANLRARLDSVSSKFDPAFEPS